MIKPLITTGLSGLVGSTFRDAFANVYQCKNLDISDPSSPVDITNSDQVDAAISNHPGDTIIHLAAFTDVNAAFLQTDDKTGLAYKVNVVGTENIAKAAKAAGKFLVHISTAYVFDGNSNTYYTENDATNPIEWYGYTKAQAEEKVALHCNSDQWAILRIDFPFRAQPSPRPDIVRKCLATMKAGYPLFDDHFFGPTYLDDFNKVLDWFVTEKKAGIWHASSGEKWSDFQLGSALVEKHSLDLQPTAGNLDTYLTTLNRPYQRNTAMDASKLKAALPFELLSIEQALESLVGLQDSLY